MTADKANEYLSDGITEEILNSLCKLDGLHVTARTSSFAFKNKNLDIREINDAEWFELFMLAENPAFRELIFKAINAVSPMLADEISMRFGLAGTMEEQTPEQMAADAQQGAAAEAQMQGEGGQEQQEVDDNAPEQLPPRRQGGSPV